MSDCKHQQIKTRITYKDDTEEEFMEWIPSGSNAEAIEYRYICQSCDITLEIVEE